MDTVNLFARYLSGNNYSSLQSEENDYPGGPGFEPCFDPELIACADAGLVRCEEATPPDWDGGGATALPAGAHKD